MSDQSTRKNSTRLVLWIVTAFLIVVLLGSMGLLLLLTARKTISISWFTGRSSARAATSFADLHDADVPGRYRIADGDKIMYIVLNEDHTFINQDGTTYAPYQWEVSTNGITITWQRSSSTWDTFESPGAYSRTKSDGTMSRMEKLPDLPPAESMAISDKEAVASVLFTTTVQTNGLALTHTDADGRILPGEAGGEQCYQLIRQRGRMSAFLYAAVAPELKTEPFTNALIMVEYFDSATRDPRNGWISLQYDGRDGVYTSTGQRVQLAGTMKWTHATFVLDAPLFTGRENSGADFRLCVAGPELSVRAIRLVKDAPPQRFLSTAAVPGRR